MVRKFQRLHAAQPRKDYQTKRMIDDIIIKIKSQVLKKDPD